MIDLSVSTDEATSLAEVLDSFREASASYMKGLISTTEEELVSSDFLGSQFSTVIDEKACVELNPRVRSIDGEYPLMF